MYTHLKLPVRPVLADIWLTMPINLLLALPEYVTRDPNAPKHNVIADIRNFLSASGWEVATKVIKPHIWAPGWSDDELKTFATSPFVSTHESVPGTLFEDLSACEFFDGQQYEIVHFTGYVIERRNNPTLYLDVSRTMEAGALRDALVSADTRLLVLNVPADQFDYAVRLAELVVGGGGPAVIVVSLGQATPLSTLDLITELYIEVAEANWGSGDPKLVTDYFSQLYLDLVHNLPLTSVAAPPEWQQPGLNVCLYYGTDGEKLLDFTRWMDILGRRMQGVKKIAIERNLRLERLRPHYEKFLRPSKRAALEDLVRSETRGVSILLNDVNENFTRLENVRARIHDHESEGALPLSEIADAVPQLEQAARELKSQDLLELTLQEEVTRAPRVLNANFRDQVNPKEMLPSDQGLEPGSKCELLVDVGPAWDELKTIVKGRPVFPVEALPQTDDGWEIDVLLISEDFSPHGAMGKLWLRSAGGQSHPYHNELRLHKPGPLVIPLHAPSYPEGNYNTASFTARARLSLYYENNLLQSAVVKVGVAQSREVVLDEENSVEIDYVLSGGFHNADRFARRAVNFGEQDVAVSQPIALNLTLNDDANGNHRIIIRPRGDGSSAATSPATSPAASPPAGYTTYDPIAAAKVLELARTELRNIFYGRHTTGAADPKVSGLDNNNGKTRDQFKLDLQTFALLGNTLFEMLTDEVQAAGGKMTATDWEKEVTKALIESSVIQVARTGHANYAIPWALVYEHPMPGPTLLPCH